MYFDAFLYTSSRYIKGSFSFLRIVFNAAFLLAEGLGVKMMCDVRGRFRATKFT